MSNGRNRWNEDDDTIPAEVIQRRILGDLGITLGAAMLMHYREVKPTTQAELGAAVGVSKQHIHALENGRRPIGEPIAAKLAKVLGVDASELLRE